MNSSLTSTALMDSISSLTSSRQLGSIPSSKGASPVISKAYKQAQNLFLTRRLSEALQTLQPIITPYEANTEQKESGYSANRSLIVSATKNVRVKVWNLYLTLLNSILELDPDERRAQFDRTEWRSLVSRVRDGSIWEEVVQVGYRGEEGNVDADVVSNLATLLISQSPSQTLNQQRLESYLAISNQPSLDISDRSPSSDSPSSSLQTIISSASGTETPRDLNSRIKILELYTLHVLPRNDEWEYAKEFITINDTLDEERREEFLQALQTLKDQERSEQGLATDVLHDESLQVEDWKDAGTEEIELTSPREQESIENKEKKYHKQSNSEKDYGIDDPVLEKVSKAQGQDRINTPKPPHSKPKKYSSAARRIPSSKQSTHGAYKNALALTGIVQKLFLNMTKSISRSPAMLLRTVLFLITLIVALSRHDIRDQLQKVTSSSWEKLRKTVGMGVKVSYI